jgi:hypothetical protein
MNPNYSHQAPYNPYLMNPANLSLVQNQNKPSNVPITNNILIMPQPKAAFRPVNTSSSSRIRHPSIKLEMSGTKIKMKNQLGSMKDILSPTKTEVSYSDKNSIDFSPSSNNGQAVLYNNYYPRYQVNHMVNPVNFGFGNKSPNFNKNYLFYKQHQMMPKQINKLNPEVERECLKKIMQIFLKMDSIKKKEVAIYKNKLIPLFAKLQIKSHRMRTLQNFLEKFLMEEKITDNDINELNIVEKIIFMAFLVKKKYFDVDCFDFKSENLEFFQKRITVKRNEQEYKIILKKAFKTMINAFNQEKGFYDSSKKHFYKEYFGDFADSQSIPLEDLELENLFNEKGKKKLKKRKSKKNYAQILRTSPNFLKRLSEYLDNKFQVGPKITGSRQDAIREIRKKVPDLINKWKTRILLEEEDNIPTHVQIVEFLGKFFTNKKVKLPWSVHEIKRAVKSVKQLLQIN